MICRARRKRAWLVSHSRLVGLGVWLKPGRSWFDSRGWDEGSPDAATRCPRRSATPMAALAITKQACRGDRPVRHTDRGRFDSGRLLRTCDLEGEECPRVARTAAEVRVTRRTSTDARHPTRANASGQHALKARRALRDAYTTRIVAASSRAFVPKNDPALSPAAWTSCTHASARTQHGQLPQVVMVELSRRPRARVVHGAAVRGRGPMTTTGNPVRVRSSGGRAAGC